MVRLLLDDRRRRIGSRFQVYHSTRGNQAPMVSLSTPAILGRLALIVLVTQALTPTNVRAGQPSPPPACDTPADRAFDFWIGRWTVTDNTDGTPAGENVIESVSEHCALLEHWTSVDGHSGKSINYYDPADDQWHQTWVGAGRSLLTLSGSFADGVMDLRGISRGRNGGDLVNRVR